MINVENVSKSFGSLEVLKEIYLEIKKGEIVAIIGPSGSGKSTLLRCMNLLEIPTSGKMWIDKIDITAKHTDLMAVRQKVGMVFQHFNLFPHMTVLENMVYAPINVKKMRRKEAVEKAQKLLKLVGLSDKAEVYPATLSGGQKQRVAIARAQIGRAHV